MHDKKQFKKQPKIYGSCFLCLNIRYFYSYLNTLKLSINSRARELRMNCCHDLKLFFFLPEFCIAANTQAENHIKYSLHTSRGLESPPPLVCFKGSYIHRKIYDALQMRHLFEVTAIRMAPWVIPLRIPRVAQLIKKVNT